MRGAQQIGRGLKTRVAALFDTYPARVDDVHHRGDGTLVRVGTDEEGVSSNN